VFIDVFSGSVALEAVAGKTMQLTTWKGTLYTTAITMEKSMHAVERRALTLCFTTAIWVTTSLKVMLSNNHLFRSIQLFIIHPVTG
jgi:hypothetical protein